MKKIFPIALIVLGALFAAGGVYAVARGLDAKDQVKTELIAQDITTPADARVPNVAVKDAATAKVMADIINKHALEASGGKTYSEMGRYLALDGTDTNDAAKAMKGADGKPLANPVRNTLFQASSLRTSLYTSIMAFNVSDLVVGLGLMILVLGIAVGGIGIALAALVIPALAKKAHVEPVLTTGKPVTA
ncbi:MAG TPA: hypothetical protein VFJ85_18550 [Acidimicrobiales bacterium]|nr:hypothetical protein [Acidimicrobiales bacterium]